MLTHKNLKSMLTELGIGFTGINAHFLAVQMHVNAERDADRPVHDIRDPRYDSIDVSLLESITAYVVQTHICYLPYPHYDWFSGCLLYTGTRRYG